MLGQLNAEQFGRLVKHVYDAVREYPELDCPEGVRSSEDFVKEEWEVALDKAVQDDPILPDKIIENELVEILVEYAVTHFDRTEAMKVV